jgi:lysophospholipase L1-like esterase
MQGRRARVGVLLGAIAVAGTVAVPSAGAAPATVTAWSASPEAPGPLSSLVTDYAGTGGRTVRDVVRLTAGGPVLRVRLTNAHGTRRLTFGDVRVALAGSGAAARGTQRVTFGGRRNASIPTRGELLSDPVRLRTRFGQRLAVSLYSAGATGTTTTSGALLHTNWISSAGDHAGDTGGAAFTTVARHWYFLGGVDVQPDRPAPGGVVAFGASITTGTGATRDAARGWVDLLADRLHAAAPGVARPVLNAGIPGNTLHESSACYGDSGPARLRHDVLAQRGVRTVVLGLGSNDITQPGVSLTGLLAQCNARTPIDAADLIVLYEQLIRRVHAAGLRIVGTTIPPFGAMAGWTPAMEAERTAVNRWMTTGGAFDGVVDFAAAVADPADPARLAATYDSGDGQHPNDAGHAALARAIPLALLTKGDPR